MANIVARASSSVPPRFSAPFPRAELARRWGVNAPPALHHRPPQASVDGAGNVARGRAGDRGPKQVTPARENRASEREKAERLGRGSVLRRQNAGEE